MAKKIVLIDNHDSFTYNIVQYLKELGINPLIFKNNEISIENLKKIDFSTLIISPGPGNPDEAGICLEILKEFYQTKKILGICLGHQIIAQFFSGKIARAKNPCHGKTYPVYFTPDRLFEGLNQGFLATRYHSLVVDPKKFPPCLEKIAWTNEDNQEIIMGLKHKTLPIYGVQFHPEAILTEGGKTLLKNFLFQASH